MIYTTFARVYDQLMDKDLYRQWYNYAQERLQLPAGAPLLELACGSGDLAIQFAQAGLNVTGLDFSAEMLALADQKQQAAGTDVEWVEGDMRALEGLGPFQAVTCFDDSLCYMPDLDNVQQVFQQVYQVLAPGGTFLFDAHSIYQIDEFFPGYMYNYKEEEMAFMWTSYEGDVPHSIEHDLSFFVWDDEIQGYQELNELHHERTYPLAAYQQALTQAGFTGIQVTADFGRQEVQPESGRWFFEAHKD
ncbi:ubiE COQ5 methyltransferase family protein [Lactobacillus selangorensis]|uniref:UbiE COQ5 methyltransferase family protein n=1 Tax=Lactobacillus selangorensis TaxID=81857 RepID=A0A0R2FMB7_9LACO|nr:class I SAM-dependent methyltransferase [Lactobacillus selangorensis]KRN29729.1 ubiE COQ5 methyltransferase family protein [Lactobacillus selangorensis]KRN33742.1 ubiE COQ5 methyltransferase family protein [Lactobacillus selangorensis]